MKGRGNVAAATGQRGCRDGHRVLYYRLPRLFEALSLAKADGTYTKVLAKIARADVLILDDLDLAAIRDAQRHDPLEILDDRYDVRSTVVTSQLPIGKWHEWLGEPTVADAILDRLDPARPWDTKLAPVPPRPPGKISTISTSGRASSGRSG